MTLELPPSELVKELSKGKAREVASKEKGIIIGADTIVVLDNQVIGKPKDKEDAKKTLQKLSGNSHYVYTGFTIIDNLNNKEVIDFAKSEIQFKEMTDEEIDEYIETGEPMDKAGSYAIQGIGKKFISNYIGSYTNIFGLPLEKVRPHLENLGVNVKK